MCVCVCARARARECRCVRACVHACVCVCVCVCVCARARRCASVCAGGNHFLLDDKVQTHVYGTATEPIFTEICLLKILIWNQGFCVSSNVDVITKYDTTQLDGKSSVSDVIQRPQSWGRDQGKRSKIASGIHRADLLTSQLPPSHERVRVKDNKTNRSSKRIFPTNI